MKRFSETVYRKTEKTRAKWKWTNNDLQNTAQKTKDRATWIPLKTWGEVRCSGRVNSQAILVTSVVCVTVKRYEHHLIWTASTLTITSICSFLYNVLWIIVYPLIVLSVLHFAVSDYPFGIFTFLWLFIGDNKVILAEETITTIKSPACVL